VGGTLPLRTGGNKLRNKTKDKIVTMFIIVVLICAFIVGTVAFFVYVGPHIQRFFGGGGDGNQTTTTTTTTVTGGTVETLQWSFTLNDRYAGGLADCAIAIVDPQTHEDLESGETGTDGVWESTQYYTSDNIYDLRFGNGTYVEEWVLGVSVPRFQGTILTGSKHRSSFEVTDQGTFTLSMAYGSSRTTISDTGDYNQTTSGNTETFYFSIYNTEVDSGYWSSRNPILDMDCTPVLEIYFTGSDYQDVQWTNNYLDKNDGAKQSYYIPLTDLSVTYDVDAQGNMVHSGQYTLSASLDFTNVAGDAVDVYCRLILGTSPSYLQGHSGLPSSSYAYTYTTSVYFNLLD
jgi:hypothetical protein